MTEELTPEQQALWQRVRDLWALSLKRDATAIRQTLHPRYVGWQPVRPPAFGAVLLPSASAPAIEHP